LVENRIGTIVEPSSLEELENSLGGFDGFTSALKSGRFEQKITRRDFAKLSGSMLAILIGISANLQSCATLGLIEEGPVHYPKLSGQKIQSPEHYGLEGCMVGYFVGSSRHPSPGWTIKKKEAQTGKTPSIFIMIYYHQTQIPTPLGDDVIAMMKTISEHGSISKVYHNKHSTKPQMICETGMDNLRYKPRWVTSGLGSMKSQLPGIKGVSFWSMQWSYGRISNFDSRIDSSSEALQAYKLVVQDPYFLGKIPYRNH